MQRAGASWWEQTCNYPFNRGAISPFSICQTPQSSLGAESSKQGALSSVGGVDLCIRFCRERFDERSKAPVSVFLMTEEHT